MTVRKTIHGQPTIAKEALRQLDGIYDLCQKRRGTAWSLHANSANSYMKAVTAVGWPLPERIIKNWRYLRTQGWIIAAPATS